MVSPCQLGHSIHDCLLTVGGNGKPSDNPDTVLEELHEPRNGAFRRNHIAGQRHQEIPAVRSQHDVEGRSFPGPFRLHDHP